MSALNPGEIHFQPLPLWMTFWDGWEQRYVAEPILGWVGETAQELRPFTHIRGAIEIPRNVKSVYLREDDAIKDARCWNGEDE